jgi:protein-tyrosine phosphatase
VVPPFKRSWCVNESLIGGPAPVTCDGRIRFDRLLEYGIKSFVDLREHSEELSGYPERRYAEMLPQGVGYKNFPIFDCMPTKNDEETHEIVEYVLAEMQKGMTYVHCHGGHGRTGMIVAALLVRCGRTVGEALGELRNARASACDELAMISSPQSLPQIEAVNSYARFLNGRHQG